MISPDKAQTLSEDKRERVESAIRIASHYEVESKSECREPYSRCFEKIARAYWDLAEELAR